MVIAVRGGSAPDDPRMTISTRTVKRKILFGREIRTVEDYDGEGTAFDGAQAYLMTCRSGPLPRHSHPVDQFQVVTDEDGWVLRYSDADVPLPPPVSADRHAGEARWLTLRSEPTDAVTVLGDDERPAPVGRLRQVRVGLPPTSAGGGGTVVLLDEPDGLWAAVVTAGGGGTAALPAAGPAGQFVLVAYGTLAGAAQSGPATEYGADAVGWRSPGSPAAALTAGPTGVTLLVTRFPAGPRR
jgi:hypothetical protein